MQQLGPTLQALQVIIVVIIVLFSKTQERVTGPQHSESWSLRLTNTTGTAKPTSIAHSPKSPLHKLPSKVRRRIFEYAVGCDDSVPARSPEKAAFLSRRCSLKASHP
jgi:hypothetical protein